ncbi:hypothetical protein C7974DRAFT_398749 [Boeremia exigua]|uniref:uncharacterized protein n=1 Tax=Boeremia exigua TaxID=749465 RepID=UPI001E8E14DC|nr:uncharacterized protein C7974DRAFT_398749 [Boeremia exigua]KAH6620038.1 hypothetical protein C7974DRAFT_398749 [Boeremia exigua]
MVWVRQFIVCGWEAHRLQLTHASAIFLAFTTSDAIQKHRLDAATGNAFSWSDYRMQLLCRACTRLPHTVSRLKALGQRATNSSRPRWLRPRTQRVLSRHCTR